MIKFDSVDPTGVSECFPCLLPLKSNFTEFEGFINILGEDIHARLSISDKEVTLKNTWNENWEPNGFPSTEICLNLEPNQTLLSILNMVKDKLESEFKTWNKTVTNKSLKYVPLLLESLDKIGWEKIESMDDSLECIVFKAVDEAQRSHLLKVKFSLNTSISPQEYFADLPSPFQPSRMAARNLDILFKDFENRVKDHQLLWNVLDEIDQETWVLEPENPQRRHCMRRFALSKMSSIQFSVLPTNPKAIPECEFFGPNNEITPLWASFFKNGGNWNEDLSILDNLREILDIEFPSKSTTLKDEIEKVCVICYSFRFNESLPDKTCENEQCSQVFHMECLYEWLHKLPSTRQSFNIFFGECPYCSKPITCKMR